MAQIPQFTAEEGRAAGAAGRLNPSETAIETLSAGARNISRLGREGAQAIQSGIHQIGAATEDLGRGVERAQTLNEISNMGPVQASIFQNATQGLNEAVASNDPEAVQNWQNRLENQLDRLSSDANTPGSRSHAIITAENLRRHFLDTALPATLAAQAGHQAIANLGVTTNILANTVANHPEALPQAIQTYNNQVNAVASAHGLSPLESAKLQNDMLSKGLDQIVGNSIASVIHGNPGGNIPSNPEAASGLIDKYAKYLTPEAQKQLAQAAAVQTRLNGHQESFDRAESERLEKRAANDALNNIWATAIQPDGSVQFSPALTTELGRIAGMPGATQGEVRGSLETLQRMATNQNKTQTDPTVYSQLLTQAFKPENDPQHLTLQDLGTAVQAGKLSNKDFGFLYQNMQRTQKEGLDAHTQNKTVDSFLTSVQAKFKVTPGIPGPGDVPYSRFMNWFQPAYAEAKTKGNVSQFLDGLLDKDQAWYDNRFKSSAAVNNAGSGLSVTGPQPGGASAPLPPAPGSSNTQPEGLIHRLLFGTGK